MADAQDFLGPAGALERVPSPLVNEGLTLAFQQPTATQLKDSSIENGSPTSDASVIFDQGEHTVNSGFVVARGDAVVRAFGDAQVVAEGSAKVEAHDHVSVMVTPQASAEVRAFDRASVQAHGWAKVYSYDQSSVDAFDKVTVEVMHSPGAVSSASVRLHNDATIEDMLLFTSGDHWISSGSAEERGKDTIVHASGDASVTAFGEATLYGTDSATITGQDHARLFVDGHATGYAFDNSSLDARGDCQVHGHDSPTIVAHGQCDVAVNDSAKLVAYDNTRVSARESIARNGGSVEAYDHVQVDAARYSKELIKLPVVLHDDAIMNDVDNAGKPIVVRAPGR